jgi:hypothetical protein
MMMDGRMVPNNAQCIVPQSRYTEAWVFVACRAMAGDVFYIGQASAESNER